MTDLDNGEKPQKKYKILGKLKKVFLPEYMSKPELVSDVDCPYIKNRLERFIHFFDSERKRNRDKERTLQYLIIGFAAAIPIVNVIGISSPLSKYCLQFLVVL